MIFVSERCKQKRKGDTDRNEEHIDHFGDYNVLSDDLSSLKD